MCKQIAKSIPNQNGVKFDHSKIMKIIGQKCSVSTSRWFENLDIVFRIALTRELSTHTHTYALFEIHAQFFIFFQPHIYLRFFSSHVFPPSLNSVFYFMIVRISEPKEKAIN